MAPSFCPTSTTILLHFPLSSAKPSPLSKHPHLTDIHPHTILPSQSRLFFLPFSLNLPTLFAILSSPIHIQWPAHLSQRFINLPVQLICTPTISLSSSILLLSTRFTSAILLTQLLVVLANLKPLSVSLCQCHHFQTIKVGQCNT